MKVKRKSRIRDGTDKLEWEKLKKQMDEINTKLTNILDNIVRKEKDKNSALGVKNG